MKVTGQRATGGTGSTRQPARTPKEKAPKKGWSEEDGFDTPVRKAASPKKARKTPRPQASAELINAGARALERDRRSTDENALRDAGWLLGGLTASVVINVIHQFQGAESAALDSTVMRLGELCGALFIEFLGGTDDELASVASSERERFDADFERSFGMGALEATARFIDFIARTEGHPRERMRGSIYN